MQQGMHACAEQLELTHMAISHTCAEVLLLGLQKHDIANNLLTVLWTGSDTLHKVFILEALMQCMKIRCGNARL